MKKEPPKGLTFTPSNHRYRLDGLPVRGVTGLISAGMPKDQLIPWAASIAAEYALDHLDSLGTMDRAEAIKLMKWEHRNVRDAAGITGTAVHKMAEQLVNTGECEVDDDLAGYVEGFAAFLDEWQIKPIVTERPVANRKDWYAGTFDLICTSPFLQDGKPVMIDLKTSKGIYGETALQCAAYSKAEFYMDHDGAEQPMIDLAATYVAHVTPMDRDGQNTRYEGKPLGTTLYQLAESPEQITEHYGMFLAAAYTAKTAKVRDGLAKEALTPTPIETKEVA